MELRLAVHLVDCELVTANHSRFVKCVQGALVLWQGLKAHSVETPADEKARPSSLLGANVHKAPAHIGQTPRQQPGFGLLGEHTAPYLWPGCRHHRQLGAP